MWGEIQADTHEIDTHLQLLRATCYGIILHTRPKREYISHTLLIVRYIYKNKFLFT
jgi:hypothetical protein